MIFGLQVRGEMQSKQKEAEDQSIIEKEREKEKAELSEDLKFNSTMGMQNKVLARGKLMV